MALNFDSITPAQALMSMYVVGHAESDLAWDGHNYYANVNYGDPITAFMVQYAGGNLRNVIRWGRQIGTWDTFLDALPSAWWDWSSQYYWSARWTEDMLGVYLDAVKNNLDEAKGFQVSAWASPILENFPRECLQSYVIAMNSAGEMPESLTTDQMKVFIYYVTRWHNSPANAKKIFEQYGIDVSLETLRDAFIALYQTFSDWDIYGEGWTNAINLNYRDLVNWDGTSAPSFDGTVDDVVSGTPGGGSSGGSSSGGPNSPTYGEKVTIKEIITNGQNLIIRTMEGKNVLCIKAQGGNVWIPRGGVFDSTGCGQTGPGSGYVPLPPTDLEAMQRVMQFYVDHEKMYGYTLEGGQYENPEESGLTNCSAFIVWAAQQLFPDGTLAGVGMYTGSMASAGETVAEGSRWDAFPYEKSQPGDLLLVNHNNYNPDFDHVELYLGTESQGNTTGSELWGAGSAPAPHRNGDAGSYCQSQHDWRLVRIPWDK